MMLRIKLWLMRKLGRKTRAIARRALKDLREVDVLKHTTYG